MSQPVEKDFFLGRVLHLVTRLRDHIERMDGGALYAVDDLAVVLRAFISTGQGNDVLQRLQRHTQVTAPDILISRAPDLQARFSVGSIPTREHAEIDGATRATLEAWANSPVVHVQDATSETTYTWGQLLNKYANKWGGAHVDSAVPRHLQVIDAYAAGSLGLTGYLLRTASVAVWDAVQSVLRIAIPSPHEGTMPPAELATRVVIAAGGVGTPPADRLAHGELQWLTYIGDRTEFLLYCDGPSQLRIATGGTGTRTLTLIPADSDPALQPPPLDEVRVAVPPLHTPESYSSGRRMTVFGHARRPPAVKPT